MIFERVRFEGKLCQWYMAVTSNEENSRKLPGSKVNCLGDIFWNISTWIANGDFYTSNNSRIKTFKTQLLRNYEHDPMHKCNKTFGQNLCASKFSSFAFVFRYTIDILQSVRVIRSLLKHIFYLYPIFWLFRTFSDELWFPPCKFWFFVFWSIYVFIVKVIK